MSRVTRDSCLVPSGTPAGEDPRVQAQLPVNGPDTHEPETAAAFERAHPARGTRLVAWASLGVSLLATVATIALDAVTPDAARAAADATVGWIIGLPGLALAVPGAVLMYRAPRNAVSWVLAMTGLLWALDGLAQSWLVFAVQSDPPLPGATVAFWFVQRFGASLLLAVTSAADRRGFAERTAFTRHSGIDRPNLIK